MSPPFPSLEASFWGLGVQWGRNSSIRKLLGESTFLCAPLLFVLGFDYELLPAQGLSESPLTHSVSAPAWTSQPIPRFFPLQ